MIRLVASLVLKDIQMETRILCVRYGYLEDVEIWSIAVLKGRNRGGGMADIQGSVVSALKLELHSDHSTKSQSPPLPHAPRFSNDPLYCGSSIGSV
jgi:hypothetical protein